MRRLLLLVGLLQWLPTTLRGQGQVPLPAPPKTPPQYGELGGVYSSNVTLFFRNSPFRVRTDLVVEVGATLTIETGVQLFFDTGVGLRVKGAIQAIGNEFAHIQMLPFQEQLNYDTEMPSLRLIDGPSVRQGRLQMRFRDRWRSVCTMLTNWTSIDTGAACRSMGYGDGGFWKWFRRNNDTFPLVLPRPACHPGARTLLDCPGLADQAAIPMSENLCQGEDDIGLLCWGPPTFTGWARHWAGLQILNSPFAYVPADSDMVAVQRQSLSRLEYLDILYAGYSGQTKNVTAALWIEGVPPIMNGLRIERSARDGLYLYEPGGSVMIANSTFAFNRGHGVVVDEATDGRVFINYTRIESNWGDGVWYRQSSLPRTPLLPASNRGKRQALFAEEQPSADICKTHSLSRALFFPYLLSAHLANGTVVDPTLPLTCWMVMSLPPRLEYTYSIQFLAVTNRNPQPAPFGPLSVSSMTSFVICDADDALQSCALQRMRVPLIDGKLPQTVAVKSAGQPLFIAVEHTLQGGGAGFLAGDVDVLFRVHADVKDKAFYGLNMTNSIVSDNIGNGILALDLRERTALSNVTVDRNQGQAGVLVQGGAADIWLNDTRLRQNWGDGLNVSFAGGAINLNGTVISGNRWRGAAVHYNDSLPFLAMHYEFVFKGRPSNNIFYLRSLVSENAWGGLLIGNVCIPAERRIEHRVLINWVELLHSAYHPAVEVFSCQRGPNIARMLLDVSGNRIEGSGGMGMRLAPAVNVHAVVSSNQFLNNNDTALLVRNAAWPQLWQLPVSISRNAFKFNRGKYIISLGMNEDAPAQSILFNQQNEVRENTVTNPFPHLRPRSTPYAALVVSSSNVKIHRNCFRNKDAEFEIGTELMAHAKVIDARENNWGTAERRIFMAKIFDQFVRYSLARIDVSPFAAVCNERNPHITPLLEYFRQFRREAQPFLLGGAIYENHDLPTGTYMVTDDLHVIPGARLTLAPGTTLQFAEGIGMLVQGELARSGFVEDADKEVVFTARPFTLPQSQVVRLVNEDGNTEVTEGRLEVYLDDSWGTVCNRSWTAWQAQLVCNQLGLVMDPEFFENWRIFPPPGELPIIMDNVRCEENEVDITRCRHDGVRHNVAAGCRHTEVVGIRCAEPRWAGVRFSLLANPPTVTGQRTMHNWRIEKGGLFDFRAAEFCAALQIDWNYHTFHKLVVRDNFWNGIDVVYNDLTKKPAIRDSVIVNNRRNGMRVRSAGITIENVTISRNGMAGLRYEPRVTSWEQRDIVSWLDRSEQPEREANNVFSLPDRTVDKLQVFESQHSQRAFLVAEANEDCPLAPAAPCEHELILEAAGYEFGLAAKLAVQIVNPVGNESDEDVVLRDPISGKQWSARSDSVRFPLVSAGHRLSAKYTRNRGQPALVLLVLFLDTQEYLDRFVHLYESRVEENAYGVSAVHYSSSRFADGTLTNRWDNEKLWFQKVNFTRNTEAALWINSPQHYVLPDAPVTEMTYDLDNCSVVENGAIVIDSHRDLFASANLFHWRVWSNTFANNTNAAFIVRLPDCVDPLHDRTHSFWMTENRWETNENVRILLDGAYAFVNISSNNFTDNSAASRFGIMEIQGDEKHLIAERNRFFNNYGNWMLRMHISSHSLRALGHPIPALIQYNYFQFNHFLKRAEDYVDMTPRSYAIGIFGSQKADVHFNRLKNVLLDFELVSGCIPLRVGDALNVTHNWWGSGNDAQIAQRIFDVDDWNTYTAANFSPYFVTEELFINFWWKPEVGQLAVALPVEPSALDLKGRMYESKRLTLLAERWENYPHYYKPFRPYRITRDLTIMPGATLTIDPDVEVHVWPGVRILVLGDLVANGTFWGPVRFKPINTTEHDEIRGRIGTRYRRGILTGATPFLSPGRRVRRRIDSSHRHAEWTRKRSRRAVAIDRAAADAVYSSFSLLRRDDPFYQRFSVRLAREGAAQARAGFVDVYNATSGEVVPLCDRQFTLRNAMVVCRELGWSTQNAQHWITPRWNYNPQLRLVKTYVEPRECRGTEPSLDRCQLRITGNASQWMCMDNEHFNFVFCGANSSLNSQYIGSWGGITFAHDELDLEKQPYKDGSRLEHTEVVGGGSAHGDALESASIQLFHRAPILDNVNVTNSSLHALQVIAPREGIFLNRLNITDNRGVGVNILTMNLQAAGVASDPPTGAISIPYLSPGMLNMCAAEKMISVTGRMLLYYKYDSRAIDCVKVFTSPKRKVGFRLLQFNLYNSFVDVGPADSLRIYSSGSFRRAFLLADFRAPPSAQAPVPPQPLNEGPSSPSLSDPVSADELAVHIHASAADGFYGFIAEVAALPALPDSHPVDRVTIRNSRIDRNDQGGVVYENTGEMAPDVVVQDCSFSENGLFLYGNISTSMQAVMMKLHNTQRLLFRGNTLVANRGGLLLATRSASPAIRLDAVLKQNLFAGNTNSTTIALLGNDYQMVHLYNCIISSNYAPFFDTVLVERVALNATGNLFFNNTGAHTIETRGVSRIAHEGQSFYGNTFTDNVALGHGHQYTEHFGFQPEHDKNEFSLRPKRQASIPVLTQHGVSFDWWTHVGNETERYRSTILAGSSRQRYAYNVFNNPANDYELTTARQAQYDVGSVEAAHNFWGWPGTESVAAGKIRDGGDYAPLVRVNYVPVLESNASLVEGECPGGWWLAGAEEFKSCYIFVGAAATYDDAVRYCESLDAFVPYLAAEDRRRTMIAERVDRIVHDSLTDVERHMFPELPSETPFWISSADIPSTHCGVLLSRSGRISLRYCAELLPFVCEKGTRPYDEPSLWRSGVVLAVVLAFLLLLLLCLFAFCWLCKARRRREEVIERKNIIRASLQLQKKSRAHAAAKRFESAWGGEGASAHESAHASLASSSLQGINDPQLAYKRMLRGGGGAAALPLSSTIRSPTDTLHTSCSSSLSTDRYAEPQRAPLTGNGSSSGSGEYTSADYYRVPKKSSVSSNPNPYAEIPHLNTFHPSKPGGVRMRDVRHGSRGGHAHPSRGGPAQSSSANSYTTGYTSESSASIATTDDDRSSTTANESSSSARSSGVSEETLHASGALRHSFHASRPGPSDAQLRSQTQSQTQQRRSPDDGSSYFRRHAPYTQSLPRRPAPPPPTRPTADVTGQPRLLSSARSNPALHEQPTVSRLEHPQTTVSRVGSPQRRPDAPPPGPPTRSLVELIHPDLATAPSSGGQILRPEAGYRPADPRRTTLVETSM